MSQEPFYRLLHAREQRLNNTLLLDKGGNRDTDNILHRSRKQIDLDKRAGNNSSLIIKLECNRNIKRVSIGGLAIRKQMSTQIGQFISHVIVRRTEISGLYRWQVVVIFL